MLSLKEIFEADFPSDFGTDDGVCYEYPSIFSEDEIAYGVSKFVIFLDDDFVIKIPFNGEWGWSYEDEESVFDPFFCQDYCAVEEEIYNKAYEEGLEMFFARTKFIGFGKNHTPIYQSERVTLYGSQEGSKIADKKAPSKDSQNKANDAINDDYCSLPFGWLARAYDFYGEEKVKKLIKFIYDTGLEDFHNGNIGFRKNGAPVLLDYSDFHE